MKNTRILTIARAPAISNGEKILFENLDGSYLDGIAKEFLKMKIVTSIHRKGIDESYLNFKNYSYEFQAKNIQIVEINDYKNNKYSLINAFSRIPQQFRIILEEILALESDIVLIMMSTYRAVFAAVVARFLGKKVILYSGNDWAEDVDSTFKWKGNLNRFFFYYPYKLMCGFAEKIAMFSAHLRFLNGYSLMQKYQAYPGKTLETKPLINIKIENLYQRENTCSNEKIKILSVANISPRKATSFLIEAIEILLEKYPEIYLDLVGDFNNDYGEEMISKTKQLKLEKHIFFRGYIPNGKNLLSIYRESDIFILPSLSEGFPRVLFEAMSQSLPIITTNIPNIYNRICQEDIAYFIPPKNSSAIVKAITQFIEDSSLRKKAITQGYNYIEKLLKQENSVEQFINILTAIDH